MALGVAASLAGWLSERHHGCVTPVLLRLSVDHRIKAKLLLMAFEDFLQVAPVHPLSFVVSSLPHHNFHISLNMLCLCRYYFFYQKCPCNSCLQGDYVLLDPTQTLPPLRKAFFPLLGCLVLYILKGLCPHLYWSMFPRVYQIVFTHETRIKPRLHVVQSQHGIAFKESHITKDFKAISIFYWYLSECQRGSKS